MNELNDLGIARRAKALVSGEDFVVEAIRKGKAKIVFLASDAGKNTSKRVIDKCTFYNVDLNVDFTSKEISDAIGLSNRMVVAICNQGIASSISKKIRKRWEYGEKK